MKRRAGIAGGLDGAQVAVVGLGASGRAATRLVLTQGGQVYVSDSRADPQTAAAGAELRALGADVEWGGHDVARVARADLIVVSPGIGPDTPVLRELRHRGVPWICEPELAFRFFSGPLIAVTGTNGKTTTTLLVGRLLEESGVTVAVGGNVGGGLAPAACELALLPEPPDWYVLEMSSFQLADIDTFRPDIGVVTNLSPDHLDRYPSVDAYYADKARLFDHADARSHWVLPSGDAAVASLVDEVPGRRHYFSDGSEPQAEAFVLDGELRLMRDGRAEALLDARDFPLLGAHNRRNALAAALAASLAGASTEGIRRGLAASRPLPHRLEGDQRLRDP